MPRMFLGERIGTQANVSHGEHVADPARVLHERVR